MRKSPFLMESGEIAKEFSLGEEYRGKIVSSFLMNGAKSFSEMTSLPKSERERLSDVEIYSSEIVSGVESQSAYKILIELSDGLKVEAVRLSDGKGRYTACLSSQVGCRMGCSFCKTGTMGLLRNMSASEIIEEYAHLCSLGGKISHIVFMGMGEALDNFDSLIEAMECLHRKDRWNISYRKMTISTSGYVPGIDKLGNLRLPVGLAVSIVSAEDRVRSSLMRINKAFPLSELRKSLIKYYEKTGRRITLEACLLKGINTGRRNAEALKSFSSGISTVINLIPWNPIPGTEYETPSESEVRAFKKYCSDLGLNVTVRLKKGGGIEGACGQLATSSTE